MQFVGQFSWFYFFVALVMSLVPFVWVIKRPLREKLYVLPYALFFFIYSGAGVAWANCSKEYIVYYFLWMLFFSLTVYFSIGEKRIKSLEGLKTGTNSWVIEHANTFIIIYILLKLIDITASGKLFNLISPPSPDLTAVMATVSEGGGGGGVIYYLNHIIFVFYFVSLYKYRKSPAKLFLLLFLPFYITYAKSGYLARSTVMGYLLVFVVSIYYYNPHLRRIIRLSVSIGLPFLLIGLSFYTFIRLGHTIDISPGEAVKLLAYQETSYPTQYDLIKKTPFDINLFEDYWEWLITLPLPGFFKDSTNDYFFNAIFTERLYGISRGSMGFAIALPGIVGEGLFFFGPYYFLHAIVLGIFVGVTYRIVKSKEEFLLYLYMGLYMAFHTARAGTVSTYSMYLKDFLFYEIIIIIASKMRRKKARIIGTDR